MGTAQLNRLHLSDVQPLSTINVWVLPLIGEVSTLSKDFRVHGLQNGFCCLEKIFWTRAGHAPKSLSNLCPEFSSVPEPTRPPQHSPFELCPLCPKDLDPKGPKTGSVVSISVTFLTARGSWSPQHPPERGSTFHFLTTETVWKPYFDRDGTSVY